jgi:hypothetical protein
MLECGRSFAKGIIYIKSRGYVKRAGYVGRELQRETMPTMVRVVTRVSCLRRRLGIPQEISSRD